MGGKSKSSSSTTNNNTSGQLGIEGDNLGVALTGVANSSVNITATDHGAVDAAFNMGGEMIEAMENVSQNTFAFTDRTLERYSASNSENLQMMAGLAGNQAAQNAENLGAVMELAKFKQDGGAVVQSKAQLAAFVAVFFIAAFVVARA
ncbi:chemotaxis protein [Vibrio cincinnatiensis]|uniref:chemotaxis protein n=1 Tax=Vibrio cincinnatiensis TaxID=675 RepID=UPI001EDDF6E2|nr:chemotaxis protein [Vibrio cincinnatiensis]MCG3758849.1 chemotaxis protein [Vibrio cincinnatiensis]MCG3762199.1 chemotaxis protein [Vibrio cincinnatiensis]